MLRFVKNQRCRSYLCSLCFYLHHPSLQLQRKYCWIEATCYITLSLSQHGKGNPTQGHYYTSSGVAITVALVDTVSGRSDPLSTTRAGQGHLWFVERWRFQSGDGAVLQPPTGVWVSRSPTRRSRDVKSHPLPPASLNCGTGLVQLLL
jgi:hypothetical protein